MSYKKTTGTASLIRHKCKNANQQQASAIKNEAVAGLLIASASTMSPSPPVLTPAPTFQPPQQQQHKQSTSSASVSSSTSMIKSEQKLASAARSKSDVMSCAEKNLIDGQIQWLSQCLISTEILSDSSYLEFLQSLVNFGADHGKQIVANFINRENISQEIIPKKCLALQNELMNELRDTEFSISYSCWEDCHNEKYVTVFVYYFTNPKFEYRYAVLGTRKCDNEANVVKIVKAIVQPYKNSSDELIKCVSEETCADFTTYPCIISRISNVVIATMNASEENKTFFKKMYQKAHEILSISMKNSFEESSSDYKMKVFYLLYQFIKSNDMQSSAIVKRFFNLLVTLFDAIASLTEMSDDGVRCVTANRVYLWYKKLLKYYSDFSCDDKTVNNIGQLILKLIKENLTNKIHELYQIAVFLNPNFKSLKFLSSSERSDLLDIIKKNLEKLMNEDSCGQPSAKRQRPNQNQTHLNDTFFEFMDLTMESVDDQVNSEIQRYMGYKLENLVDIVEFWATNDSFPYLKRLARNYLNLPSCTFHSNCCFLNNENEFYQKCKNLASDEIEHLSFLHQNL